MVNPNAPVNEPTWLSVQKLLAATPLLQGCAPLTTLRSLDGRVLLHAGPPFPVDAAPPAPIMNSAVAACLFEGWAIDAAEARRAIDARTIRFEPAQDHGVVTPLAFVVSPSMWMLVVADAGSATTNLAPINDGPPPAALRFGSAGPGRSERLAQLAATGPAFAEALADPIAMLPVMQAGLKGGDDLHGRVTAANEALSALLLPRLAGAARTYVESASQFVLNPIMAACAAMLRAGAGVPGSEMVTAAGGNGLRFGWRIASRPDSWLTAPATTPIGPSFGSTLAGRLPAIGDSAVIDACGFGAASLRFSPEMTAQLVEHVDPVYFDDRAHDAFIAAHPAFDREIRLGLDLSRPHAVLGVLLAAIDAGGTEGLVGRGVAPWPAPIALRSAES